MQLILKWFVTMAAPQPLTSQERLQVLFILGLIQILPSIWAAKEVRTLLPLLRPIRPMHQLLGIL